MDWQQALFFLLPSSRVCRASREMPLSPFLAYKAPALQAIILIMAAKATGLIPRCKHTYVSLPGKEYRALLKMRGFSNSEQSEPFGG